MNPELQKAAAQSRALLVLFGERAAKPMLGSSEQSDWTVLAPALVARCAYLLGSILKLQEAMRGMDAAVLLRALYEHTVLLAWLALDPATRVARFVAADRVDRLAADADARTLGVVDFLSAEARARFEDEASTAKKLPRLVDLAREAADGWGSRSAYFHSDQRYSFRGDYLALFRYYSAVVHPRFLSLTYFVRSTDGTYALRVPEPSAFREAFTNAPRLFADALVILGEATGWIDPERVVALFE